MEDINRILELNQTFYKKVQEEFSKTRQRPFKGWERVGEYIINNYDHANILDLGCGNGRFIKYVSKNYPELDLSYTGVDTNDYLLKQAETQYPKGTYQNIDIFKDTNKIEGGFDVIVGFGITHHLPSLDFAEKWLNQVLELLKNDGVLILSFWMFEESPGKYILGWNNRKGVSRMCKQFSEIELKKLFSKTYLISKFKATPSKRGNYNVYYILKRK